MKLQVPFIQLPWQFNAERLAAEIDRLGADAWRPHPQKYPGNWALPLIAVNGNPDDDSTAGPMRPTPHLARCPYLTQVLAKLDAVWGRSRLMKLDPGCEVTPHADIHYYWRDHARVHVPIATAPSVRFICGDAEVNMGAGECWIFDTWSPHRVINGSTDARIHLVADTVGSESFWALAARGRATTLGQPEGWHTEWFDADGAAPAPLKLESVNVPTVMTPWELREHIQFILAHAEPHSDLQAVQDRAGRFISAWRALWARYGDQREGWPAYRETLDAFIGSMSARASTMQLTNGMQFLATLRSMVTGVALADRDARDARPYADDTATRRTLNG